MKLLKIILPIAIVFLSSCATVTRWPNESQEQRSRSIEVEQKESIFSDFLWTVPDVEALPLEQEFQYKGYDFKIRKGINTIYITYQDKEYSFHQKLSDNDYYKSKDELKEVKILKQRWVGETRMVSDWVPVTKTRQVPTTTYGVNGISMTTWRTEFYTVHETRMVPRTEWVWRSYWEDSYEIPQYNYYDISLPGNLNFIIYETEDRQFYLQNPGYLLAEEKNKEFWGKSKVNILFLDSNSNGSYFDDSDEILFNVWNPYSQDSRYTEMHSFIDNRWYNQKWLEDNYFIDFSRASENEVKIGYANEKYIEQEGMGRLEIKGVKDIPDSKIMINGKNYLTFFHTKYRIEFGKYRLIISVPGHMDYEEVFVINQENSKKIIDYKLTDEAGKVAIENLFAENWVTNFSGKNFSRDYFNQTHFSIPQGRYLVTIYVNGFILEKELDISPGSEIVIDFEEEIQNLKGNE